MAYICVITSRFKFLLRRIKQHKIMKKLKISFDFDGTMSESRVQEYALELIERGIDVWVCTSRYSEENKHKYPLNPSNDDMYMVTDVIGIPREKIIFTDRCIKANHLDGFLWHLDDISIEIDNINISDISCVGVSVLSSFKLLCEKLIRNYERINNRL